jgi:hypothetical protein
VFVDLAWRFRQFGGSVTELSVTENCHGRNGDNLICTHRGGGIGQYSSLLKIRVGPPIPDIDRFKERSMAGRLSSMDNAFRSARSQQDGFSSYPRGWGRFFDTC